MTSILTERRLRLDDPDRAEKPLLDADRRMEEFLAVLGHEMRNPLGALSHALQVWPQSAQDPAQMEELRHIMERQVLQLKRLSDDLLDVARIARGKLELHRGELGLRQVIEAACEEVQPFIDRCGHELTVTIPGEPMILDRDASRLTQVFANLIQNAAKFTEGRGSLFVRVERREAIAVVQVCDNGRGIDEHMLPVIFDAFVQGHGAHNDGLGIGLRLVKKIVELHGGTVAVHSEGPGQGSEFTVQLPLKASAVPARQTGALQSVAANNGNIRRPPSLRILVVDDDRASATLLARMLRSIDQVVTVANDGETAIRMALEDRPQIVFLDIVMRGMDGCEVACQLRRQQELDGLALIALSGNGDEESIRQAMQAGFDKYLVKPTSIAALAETLYDISTVLAFHA